METKVRDRTKEEKAPVSLVDPSMPFAIVEKVITTASRKWTKDQKIAALKVLKKIVETLELSV